MYELMWFLAGSLFGGVIGVVCDRAYQWYENRIRIDAVIGYHRDSNGQWGVQVTLTNGGAITIPPSNLQLRGQGGGTDRLGTMQIFLPSEKEKDAPWLPKQDRVYSCPLDFRFGPVGFGPFFEMIHNHRGETDVILQLEQQHSDQVLWRCLPLGQTMLKLLASAFEERGLPKGNFFPMHAYYSSPKRTAIRYWRKITRPFRKKKTPLQQAQSN